MITLDDLRAVSNVFAERLDPVTRDQWDLPTPCTEWSVRQLVAHATGGNRFGVALLHGASAEEAQAAARTVPFADDVRAEVRRTAEEQLAAFAEPGALDRVCHHPVGDMPGGRLLGLRFGDLLVHAWDLATAVGGRQDLDGTLVERALEVYEPRAGQLAQTGLFAPGPTRDPADLTPQERLLDLVGRLG